MTNTPPSLAGRHLPGDSFTVEPYEDWLLRDVLLAQKGETGELHPMWAFVALQRSIGITLDELFDLCRASPDLPPLLGETRIEILAPMAAGQCYSVAADIADVRHKASRRTGSMDVVEVRAEARDTHGILVARLVNAYIFPRGDS